MGTVIIQKICQPWEVLYLRFIGSNGECVYLPLYMIVWLNHWPGILMPVKVAIPSISADVEEDMPEASSSKGKGRA